MSRIGVQPVTIPEGVTIEINDGGDFGYKEVVVKGPKGELTQSIRAGISFELTDDAVTLSKDHDTKQLKSNHGLYRSLISNMVQGVTEGYSKELEIMGIGYRAEMQGENVVFSLGYSHKINYTPPVGITITIDDQTKVKVEGINKQVVGEVAAKIRAFRKPEPYKGKGVRYKDEVVKRKSAKSAAAA